MLLHGDSHVKTGFRRFDLTHPSPYDLLGHRPSIRGLSILGWEDEAPRRPIPCPSILALSSCIDAMFETLRLISEPGTVRGSSGWPPRRLYLGTGQPGAFRVLVGMP